MTHAACHAAGGALLALSLVACRPQPMQPVEPAQPTTEPIVEEAAPNNAPEGNLTPSDDAGPPPAPVAPEEGPP